MHFRECSTICGGVSKSFQKLRVDAAWWLANSLGQVNLVLIMSIDQTSPEISFQVMVLDPATTTPVVRKNLWTSSSRRCSVVHQPLWSITSRSRLIGWKGSQASSEWCSSYKSTDTRGQQHVGFTYYISSFTLYVQGVAKLLQKMDTIITTLLLVIVLMAKDPNLHMDLKSPN